MALLGSEGKYVQLGFGVEPIAGTGATVWQYARIKNLKMKPERPLTFSKNNTSRGAQLKGRNLSVHIPIAFSFDPDVDTLTRLNAHFRGYAGVPADNTGSYTWTIRDFIKGTDTMSTSYDTLAIEGDRDDGFAQIVYGAVLDSRKIKIADKQLVDVAFAGVGQHYTDHGPDVVSADGGTYTGHCMIRGTRVSEASTTVTTLKYKCTTLGALDGTAKVKWTKGAVDYGATEHAVVSGIWYPLLVADDTNASGDPLEPMEFCFLSGGTLSLNDERTFAFARTKGTASYSTRNPLTAVAMSCKIAGTSYVVESAEIDTTRPYLEHRGGGSRYPYRFLHNGLDDWKITLTRKYTDRVLWDLLKAGTAATFDVDVLGDQWGATAFYDRWRLYFPQIQVAEAGSDPDKPGALDEKIIVEPSWDGTNPVCTETMVNSLATL